MSYKIMFEDANGKVVSGVVVPEGHHTRGEAARDAFYRSGVSGTLFGGIGPGSANMVRMQINESDPIGYDADLFLRIIMRAP